MRINPQLQTALKAHLQDFEGEEGSFDFGRMQIRFVKTNSEKGQILQEEGTYNAKTVIFAPIKVGEEGFFVIF